MLVHHQHRAALVVDVVLHVLVIRFQRQVHRTVHQGPVNARGSLPARLGTDLVGGQAPAVGRRHVHAVGNHMNVLPHGVEARLHAGQVVERVFAGKAYFGPAAELVRAGPQELRPAQAGVDRKAFVYLPGVADIEGRFHRPFPRKAPGYHQRGIAFRQQFAGIEVIPCGVQAIGKRMGVGERTLEVHLGEGLVDVRLQRVGRKLVERVFQSVVIAVVAGGGRHGMPVVEDAVPFDRTADVPVPEGRIVAETELVAREIAVGVDGVALVDLVADAEVHVLERGTAARIAAACGKQVEDPVGIGGPAAQDEGRAVLDDGAFQMQAARQQAQAQRALKLLAVAVAAADLEHGGDAAAVLGGNRALVEFHVVDHVGIEGRQDAEHMVRVVDRPAVEQDEVLVGGAAADVEAAGGLAHRFDAGKRHHHLQGIGLAEGHRHVFDQVDAHLLDAHLRGAVLRHALGRHHRSLERIDFLLHHHVERAVIVDHQVKYHVFVGENTESQLVGTRRQRNLVESEGIGLGKGLSVRKIDRNARERLAAGDVAHVAADGGPAGLADAVRVADLVGLVLEGHDHGLFGQVFLERRVDRRLALVEIAGGQFRGDVRAPDHEELPVVGSHRISVLAQAGERLFQELFPGHADRIVGVVGGIPGEIDVRRNLVPDESDEFVNVGLVDAERLLGRRLPGGRQGDEERQQQEEGRNKLSHRDSTYFRASVQKRSSDW